jgi:hypothetical protein
MNAVFALMLSAAAQQPGFTPTGLPQEPTPESAAESEEQAHILEPIEVMGQRVANLQPAASYASTATALRFDPQINLQARGMPESQADITVRGGLFENTGFRLGAVTVFDPQTGHYSVEIPIDPDMLTYPELLTDFDNSLRGFNANVATVNYGFSPVRRGGNLEAGAGSDGLLYGILRSATSHELDNGRTLGSMLSMAASSGDGTVPNGDHDFKRFSGQVQFLDNDSETNLLLGYHDRFSGWPGMYTGFAVLPETDHTKLGLVLVDHRWLDERGWWEIGAAYRFLEDDYDFDRNIQDSGGPGSFQHETRSFALGLAGAQFAAGLDWYFNGQFSADRLVRSTDLTHGYFNSRSYLSFSLAPGKQWLMSSGSTLSLAAGIRFDASNRDENALMPLFSLDLEKSIGDRVTRFSLDFSRTSQLPGYTALNSPPLGLFGGNPDLGREYANTLTFGFTHETSAWTTGAALFYRKDDDLVDWTYVENAPYTRQANAVDLDVTGFEAFVSWQTRAMELIGSYTWLDKNADYGAAQVDASYYALNYARQRFTLAAVYTPSPSFELRLDNEYLRQVANSLRTGPETAYLASLSAFWYPDPLPRMYLRFAADNLANSEFQEFPGTPPMGRQVSLGLGLEW